MEVSFTLRLLQYRRKSHLYPFNRLGWLLLGSERRGPEIEPKILWHFSPKPIPTESWARVVAESGGTPLVGKMGGDSILLEWCVIFQHSPLPSTNDALAMRLHPTSHLTDVTVLSMGKGIWWRIPPIRIDFSYCDVMLISNYYDISSQLPLKFISGKTRTSDRNPTICEPPEVDCFHCCYEFLCVWGGGLLWNTCWKAKWEAVMMSRGNITLLFCL
jgi:hypothetical protein